MKQAISGTDRQKSNTYSTNSQGPYLYYFYQELRSVKCVTSGESILVVPWKSLFGWLSVSISPTETKSILLGLRNSLSSLGALKYSSHSLSFWFSKTYPSSSFHKTYQPIITSATNQCLKGGALIFPPIEFMATLRSFRSMKYVYSSLSI